jgi:hypothetical protein
MRRKNTRSKGRFFAVLAVAGLIGVATYAFTNTNSVDPSRAGNGAGAISGYLVTDVQYTLNPLDPATISAYSFDLDGDARTVKASLTGAAPYDNCAETNAVTDVWTCTPLVPSAVTDATNLRVIAAQ